MENRTNIKGLLHDPRVKKSKISESYQINERDCPDIYDTLLNSNYILEDGVCYRLVGLDGSVLISVGDGVHTFRELLRWGTDEADKNFVEDVINGVNEYINQEVSLLKETTDNLKESNELEHDLILQEVNTKLNASQVDLKISEVVNPIIQEISSKTTKTYVDNLVADKVTQNQLDAEIESLELTVPTLNNIAGFKIWTTVVTTNSDGWFTVDYSSAGFTQTPHVIPVAYSPNTDTDTSANNASWVCIIKGSETNTQCKVRTKSADSAGLLAAMVAVNISTTVKIIAIGL